MRLLSNLHVKGKPAVLPDRAIRSQSHYFIYRPCIYVFGIVHFVGLINELIDLKDMIWTTKKKSETTVIEKAYISFVETNKLILCGKKSSFNLTVIENSLMSCICRTHSFNCYNRRYV